MNYKSIYIKSENISTHMLRIHGLFSLWRMLIIRVDRFKEGLPR